LSKARDCYRYINDQTLRLANQGYTEVEIAEMIKLPKELAQHWALRGYYGTMNHNVKATYVKYLGWFDGNPATLHVLPPVEASKKYVEFMGGPEAALKKAKAAYAKGEYRWVAEVVNHVVFADPNNKAAKELQADVLEQMGYQAESGPWRNFYLTGAKELREGLKSSRLLPPPAPIPSRL
jgi:alkyl sulfatase BDS1-like metallo-beta-lactamase superfamily hydrolase